jgi:hypothetical protein
MKLASYIYTSTVCIKDVITKHVTANISQLPALFLIRVSGEIQIRRFQWAGLTVHLRSTVGHRLTELVDALFERVYTTACLIAAGTFKV